jgi:hypothetical protein
MRLKCIYSTTILLLGIPVFTVHTDHPHENRYQGFGATTKGGGGQPVYRVTTLQDSGPGSLRDGLSKSNRHIVFDVGGEIVLTQDIFVEGAHITIDGLTAPAAGITLRNSGLVISGDHGAHDIIVRGIRVRDAGRGADKRVRDGISISRGAYSVVIDHVSIHGSEDGNLDITDSRDVTVSWSILAKPSGTEKNLLIKYNPAHVTLHHNILLDARQRNPHVRIDEAGTRATATTLDMRNNVIWNWRGGYGTQVWYGPRVNIVNNFYSNLGFSSNDGKQAIMICTSECDGSPASAARAYVAGNVSNDGFSDYINDRGTESVAFPAPDVNTTDARTACKQVIAYAGVRPLDAIDEEHLARVSCS